MLQLEMIECFKEACQRDERISGVLMFGSFTVGEGDAFSDIEFAVFIQDDEFENFEQKPWLNSVSPLAAYFIDDFGHHTALFHNGVRGEFHFERASNSSIIASWQGYGWFPSLSSAVILDRTGELSQYASLLVGGPPIREGASLVEGLTLNLINLMLLGANLLNRGEFARAWVLLSKVHENLLKLIRLHEGVTDHWPTPSRALEQELSTTVYDCYIACTSSAQPTALCAAYQQSWNWSCELFKSIVIPLNVELPHSIIAHVSTLLDKASANHNLH
ncbi:lincosamide nucleotidyltransferase Lnu(F) [Stenotrophomonas sp. JC08]|uniref:lincosamide nucleotidyltransferase Lnu(F) n=1 Tax=Stenotrophomonas sp. JC08 TaxID=3445779 RepID=UPI003FA1B253